MIVTIGVIIRAHGVRGDVLVDVRTDFPDERFAEGRVVRTEPKSIGPLTITRAKKHGERMLVSFADIHDRAAAEVLKGTELQVEISADERTGDPDEFFDHQLIGLTVVLDGGTVVGDVSDVIHGAAQDLLAIRVAVTEADVLVPFVADIVTAIDLEAGQLILDPPEGLLNGGAG